MASPATTTRVVETIRVTPSSDSPESATDFTLPLTFFDIFWFKFHPVERLFFYQLDESTAAPSHFNSIILPKLKHSLSLTLLHYLPLAGNLRWPSDSPKPIIIYTLNDGVSVTIAESNSNFNLLAGSEIHEGLESNSLVPHLDITDDVAPVIALQITLFPSQGFSIGITSHHAVLDGKSSTMFIKSWAHFCKHGNNISSTPELTPFYDRAVIKDPTGLDVLFLHQWLEFTNSDPNKRSLMIVQRIRDVSNDLARATFDLSRENIKKLREKVLTKVDKAKPLHLSSFVLTYAYVSTCWVKMKGGESGRKVFLTFAVDARSRLDPPVPENYFGNCVLGPSVLMNAEKLMNEDGFNFAVELVNDMINEMETKGILVDGIEEQLKEMFDLFKEPGIQLFAVAGSPRFGVYGTDFGWGKPRKVEVVSIDRGGAMGLAESGDGSGGVEIGLAMSRPQMESFAYLFFDGLK